jgi:hypothetical protein
MLQENHMILKVNKKLSGKKEKQTSLQKKHWCSRKTTEAADEKH